MNKELTEKTQSLGLPNRSDSDIELHRYAEEFREVRRNLEQIHAVFYMLWEMGVPIFTRSLPTAAVFFDKEGRCLRFAFNPDFWDDITIYDKCFILCHEMFHILLSHGVRLQGAENSKVANVAADIVINEMLVNNLGFSRKALSIENDIIFFDTVFGKQTKVQKNREFEYYYLILMEDVNQQARISNGPSGKGQGNKGLAPIDDHSQLPNDSDKNVTQDIADGLQDSLTEKEITDLKKMIKEAGDEPTSAGHQPGTVAGDIATYVPKKAVVQKRCWQSIIRNWAKRTMNDYHQNEQWTMRNRRFHLLNENLLLPSDAPTEAPDDVRYQEVWFFQDTSGSCLSWAERFFNTAMTFPDDIFDVKLHCFDTKVYKVDKKKRKLFGFGGTYFYILEEFIQAEIKKTNCAYPKAIFVFTDGWGDNVNPEYPERWYWFLSEGGSTGCIPKESETFDLKDFEDKK